MQNLKGNDYHKKLDDATDEILQNLLPFLLATKIG